MSNYTVLKPAVTDKAYQADVSWSPPTVGQIMRFMGNDGTRDRYSQGSNWLNRRETRLLGKGASKFEAMKADTPELHNKPKGGERNGFYQDIVDMADRLVENVESVFKDQRGRPIVEAEHYQRKNAGIATGNYDAKVIQDTSIKTLLEYNKEEIQGDREQYEVGLQDYYDEVSSLFKNSTFKYSLQEGILSLPAGSFGAGPEAQASKQIKLKELSRGLPLFGDRYKIQYTKSDIIKIRKSLAAIGYFAGVLKPGTGDRLYANDDYLTLREILLFEMVVKHKGNPDMWIDMLIGMFKAIGHPLKPGLRVQHIQYADDVTSPKLRIFMMNMILVNVLLSPIVHGFQGQAKRGFVHSSGTDKLDMIEGFNALIKKMHYTKFLSVDYSKFDHTVAGSLLYGIRANWLEFARKHATDDETIRILDRLKEVILLMSTRSYLLYPKRVGMDGGLKDVDFQVIRLYNQLASGVIDTQLSGTHKSQADMRAFGRKYDLSMTGRLVTLSDDIIVMLTQQEYLQIAPDYDEVNEAISKFFASIGATVNPKKQPPSHDGGIFLQYVVSPDPLICGWYPRTRLLMKLFVPEFGPRGGKLEEFEKGQELSIERIGQVNALNNASRMLTSSAYIDAFDTKYFFPEFLKRDTALGKIIQSGGTRDIQSSGRLGSGFGELIRATEMEGEELIQRLGETVYSKGGLRDANPSQLFAGSIADALPAAGSRTFRLLQDAAQGMTFSIEVADAVNKVYRYEEPQGLRRGSSRV